MVASINTSQKVPLSAGYQDANGSTVGVTPPANDNFTWSIDQAGFATLDATTGQTVNLVAAAPGTGTVTLSDSAGLPVATWAYTIIPDAATGLVIIVGTPVAK